MEEEREKYRRLWRDSCQQLAKSDGTISEREAEVATFKPGVAELESVSAMAVPPQLQPSLPYSHHQPVSLAYSPKPLASHHLCS